MNNIPSKKLSVIIYVLCSLLILVGCSGRSGTQIQRIALLAPFEGRNSEIGYDAYYSVRMAIHERGNDTIELLAIDDGGSTASAIERAKALASDPLVKVVITLGNNATQLEAQQAFRNVPVIIVGQWQTKPTSKNIYMLASAELENVLTSFDQTVNVTEAAEMQSPIVGNELFSLSQIALLSKNLDRVMIASSGSLPNNDFRQRYLGSGQYVPEPGLLATLSYDAAAMALEALQSPNPNETLANNTFSGLNGKIHFVDGYWADAPIHYFRYDDDGKLTPINRPVK